MSLPGSVCLVGDLGPSRQEALNEAARMLEDRATADAGWAKRMDEDGDQHSALVHRITSVVRRDDAARIRALGAKG